MGNVRYKPKTKNVMLLKKYIVFVDKSKKINKNKLT